jgi:hypothetical protein
MYSGYCSRNRGCAAANRIIIAARIRGLNFVYHSLKFGSPPYTVFTPPADFYLDLSFYLGHRSRLSSIFAFYSAILQAYFVLSIRLCVTIAPKVKRNIPEAYPLRIVKKEKQSWLYKVCESTYIYI